MKYISTLGIEGGYPHNRRNEDIAVSDSGLYFHIIIDKHNLLAVDCCFFYGFRDTPKILFG